MIVCKNKHIFGQVLSWIIDLNFNGAQTVTDNGNLSQNILAWKKVCTCDPCIGGCEVDCYPQRFQLHIQELTKKGWLFVKHIFEKEEDL